MTVAQTFKERQIIEFSHDEAVWLNNVLNESLNGLVGGKGAYDTFSTEEMHQADLIFSFFRTQYELAQENDRKTAEDRFVWLILSNDDIELLSRMIHHVIKILGKPGFDELHTRTAAWDDEMKAFAEQLMAVRKGGSISKA